MDMTSFQEIMATDRSDMSSRYRSASMISEAQGDTEMAKVLKILSAQMDFDDNEEASVAITKTKEKLDELIAERVKRRSDKYTGIITDDSILKFSGGKVTAEDYSLVNSEYEKGGIYDPDIFGGSGRIPVCETESVKVDLKPLGRGTGHIELNCRVVLPAHYSIIAGLLGKSYEYVEKIAKYIEYVVLDEGESDASVGDLVKPSEYDAYKEKGAYLGIGGSAIYDLLCNLDYSDMPERLAFKIIPVIPPRFRPLIYTSYDGCMATDCISNAYCRVIQRNLRLEKLVEMGAPQIIISNECRMLSEVVADLDRVAETRIEYSRKSLKNPKVRAMFISYLRLLRRHYQLGLDLIKDEKTSEIESLNLFPDMIQLIGDDDTVCDIDFKTVVDSCAARISRHMSENMSSEEYLEDDTGYEEQRLFLEKLQSVMDSIWDGARAEKSSFTVRYNPDLDMYEPVG